MTLHDILTTTDPSTVVTVADYITGKIHVLCDTVDRVLAFCGTDDGLRVLKSRRVCSLSVGECSEMIVLVCNQ